MSTNTVIKKAASYILIAMVLAYQEMGAPRWIFVHVLAAIALLRVLPSGRMRNMVRAYQGIVLLILVLMTLPFMVLQVRQALFPQLEKPWHVMGEARVAALDEELRQKEGYMDQEVTADRQTIPAPPKVLGPRLTKRTAPSSERAMRLARSRTSIPWA